jgi:hypothetical protein
VRALQKPLTTLSLTKKNKPQASGPDVVSFHAPPPGEWTALVLGFGDETDYDLEVVLTPPSPPLAAEDGAVLRALADACCPADDKNACRVLRAAVAALDAKPGTDAAAGDLCGRPPNACDAAGRLTSLALAGEDLACRFPPDLARLARLVSLDLTANSLHGSFEDDVGPALKAMAPRLTAARLSLNKLEGALTCDLVGGDSSTKENGGGLRVLAVTGNRASGALPACLFAGPVAELYAARNELGGDLPPIPAGSPLVRVALSDQGGGGGFTGSLPDLAAATALVSFHADGGRLDGRLPAALPPNLTDLSLARNALTGPIPEAWGGPDSALAVFDAEANDLSGPIPARLAATPGLIRLSLGRNALHGRLPDLWGPALEHFSAPFNSISGPLPAGLARPPGLALLDLQSNRLDGGLSPFADALEAAQGARRSMFRYLNLGGNALTGSVPPGLASAGALGPGAWASTSPDHVGPDRPGGLIGKTLNLSHNAFEGEVPSWAVVGLATTKDVAVALAGNDWDCPDLKAGGSSTAAQEWQRVARAALPTGALAGVECVPPSGGSGGRGRDRAAARVPLASLLQVVGGGSGDAPSSSSSGRGGDAEDVDTPPSPPSSSASSGSRGGGDAGDVDAPPPSSSPPSSSSGAAPSATRDRASGGKIVRPKADDDDDEGGGAASDVDRPTSHDDSGRHAPPAAAPAPAPEEQRTPTHHHSSSFFTKAASVVTALAAAAATLAAGRAALPALLARHATWRAPASVPLAGLGAFDDGGFDPDPVGFAMEMGKAGGSGSNGGVVELKARAGGAPAGPVIDATGGGIGAYRPPAAALDEEEAGGSGGRDPPPPGGEDGGPPLI